MRFSDLNIQEKAAVIKLGIGSGLRSLLLIEDFYNSISDGGDNASSVLVNKRSSTHNDGNKRNERRVTIRDWLRGNKKDVNNTLNNMMYVDNGGKPYVNGSVASMDRLPWVPSVNTDTGQVSSRPDTYYYDNEGLLHIYPGNHVEPVKRMSQGEISDFFWLMENPNNVGLNLDNGMYYKYRDPNGKDWDVGPGLVIGKAIEDKPYYTKEELDRAAYKYHMDAMDKLAPLYDEKYGSGAFGNIDDRSKLVASDVMYRVGLNGVNPEKWPNMFDAINSGDIAMMLQLSRSKFKDKNNIQNYDNARVKRLGEYLYPGEFEYIFRNSLDPNIMVRKVELKKKGGYLSSTSPEYPPIIQKVNRSKADFVQRLKDPNRAYILDWDNPDNIATHKLSWVDDGIVYPLVLNVNGRLVDFSRPPYGIWAGYDNAVRNSDTIHMTPEEAEWFTTHYKDYYPGFDEYKKGGSIHIKPENRGKFTALKKRTGHSASWFKKHGTPALKKMATFALNARKWHHKHQGGGYLDNYIYYDGDDDKTINNNYSKLLNKLNWKMHHSAGSGNFGSVWYNYTFNPENNYYNGTHYVGLNLLGKTEQQLPKGRDHVNLYTYGDETGFDKIENANPITVNGNTYNYKLYYGNILPFDTIYLKPESQSVIDSMINNKDILGVNTDYFIMDLNDAKKYPKQYNKVFSHKNIKRDMPLDDTRAVSISPKKDENGYYFDVFDVIDYKKTTGKAGNKLDKIVELENIQNGPYMLRQRVPVVFNKNKDSNGTLLDLISQYKDNGMTWEEYLMKYSPLYDRTYGKHNRNAINIEHKRQNGGLIKPFSYLPIPEVRY